MDVSELIATLESEGHRLARAAERVGVDADVPTCPGWRVRDLLLHIGGVHRWAGTVVTEPRREPLHLERAEDISAHLPADAELIDWFRRGHTDLLKALRNAPEDLRCWAFLTAPTPLAFWARRQAHETTVHRVDVESADGAVEPVGPDVATDGIDELLGAFVPRDRTGLHSDPPTSMSVRTTDTGACWLLHVSSGPVTVERSQAPADTVVSGAASDVYLALWNRLPLTALDVAGSAELPRRWPEAVRIRWG
ncbi:maleylpyruvate isomerase family mycothiol-dependent enzyme [Haloechinothrix sp. YIM 98757]|uniref:Maleylpyruvate isomerase family mycothiol-dependent enzyme n=1 Tax=Haloechinothrix aidingensis TaxID=2752311 RepID=A0A838A3T6_9PSEU|nr:maleylpyruvate isomerase family mycothiol-dependent enzyme [Haloechinothrix aidingensis]MBA0125963.1 maleylpyruvate isomerase family mycothiol-dependent enzyme [Haloechinothrix aidingensis]